MRAPLPQSAFSLFKQAPLCICLCVRICSHPCVMCNPTCVRCEIIMKAEWVIIHRLGKTIEYYIYVSARAVSSGLALIRNHLMALFVSMPTSSNHLHVHCERCIKATESIMLSAFESKDSQHPFEQLALSFFASLIADWCFAALWAK